MDILHNLIQAHRLLGLSNSPSQAQVWEEIRMFCLNTKHPNPAKTLLAFPPRYIRTITQDETQGFEPFVKQALADMSNIGQLSNPIFEMDSETLTLLKQFGLEYDRHINHEMALALWLEKDPVFGKDAWKAKFPRKNPATAYWEKEGLNLPRRGVSEDGMAIFINAIENFPKVITRKMQDKCMNAPYYDWRLLVALHMKGYKSYIPATYNPWTKVRGLRKVDAWRNFFKDKPTGHAELAHTKMLQSGPELQDLLSRDAMDIPENPTELFQTS